MLSFPFPLTLKPDVPPTSVPNLTTQPPAPKAQPNPTTPAKNAISPPTPSPTPARQTTPA